MPPALAKWCSPAVGFFVCLWLALMALGPDRMFRDPGTFWHTVVGEQILQTGRLPNADSFSYTHAGQPWIAQQWLGEIAMAMIHRIAGLDGLLLGAATLLSALFTWLAVRLVRGGAPWPVTGVFVLLVIGASSYHFIPRPHLATMALMALAFAIFVDVESGRAAARRLFLIPPIMVVWTNTHGGALGGLATVVAVLLAWLLAPRGAVRPMRRWSGRLCQLGGPANSRSGFEAFSKPGPLILGTVAALSITAVLLNPYGPKLPAVWLGLMTSDVLPRPIIEHAPLKFRSVEAAMILGLAAIYITLLIRAWPTHRRITWLVPLLWLVLTLTRVRHGPLFAVTAALAVADMLPSAGMAAWHSSLVRESLLALPPAGIAPHESLPDAPRRKLIRSFQRMLPAAVLVLTALVLQIAGTRLPLIGADRCRPNDCYWPVKTAIVLQKELQRNPNARLFNDMLFGGYLLYAVPQARLYIDDRCELYGDQGLLLYSQLCADPILFDALAAYDAIDVALVIANTPLDRHLAASPRWLRLFAEPSANLYRRRS